VSSSQFLSFRNFSGSLTEAGQHTRTSYLRPISSDSRAKNSTVGLSNDNCTAIFLAAGFEGERVTRAGWDSRGSNGAGGAIKITFSVFAKTHVDKRTRVNSSNDRILGSVEHREVILPVWEDDVMWVRVRTTYL
jgi:hypothetical protein